MRRNRGITTIATVLAATLVIPSGASALTKLVYAGAPQQLVKSLAVQLLGKQALAVKAYNPAFLSFHAQRVTINQGDSVMWTGLSQGHTVDLPGKGGHDLPLFTFGSNVTGVNDFAGSPFWFNGVEPTVNLNSQLNAPIGGHTYNGTARVDSSSSAKKFKVTFTKPGVYKYFCDIHPGMVGYVVVRPKRKPIPSAKQDAAAVKTQLTTDILSAKKLLAEKQPADTVDLGLSGADGLAFFHFFPASLSIKSGTVVTFKIPSGERAEGHTAAFGPVPYLTTLANAQSGPGIQEGAWPSSNPAQGPIVLTPASHGNGFANTGILDQDPGTAFPSSEKIDFTTPGTYHFVCLIHPFMSGTIVVH